MSAQDLEQRARELLAAEYIAAGYSQTGKIVMEGPWDAHPSIRAIVAALRQQPAPVVDDAMRELIEAAGKVKRAYWLARNSAAGLTNYCEESGSTRRCERELAEAERIYRDSGFEAALARAQGVQP